MTLLIDAAPLVAMADPGEPLRPAVLEVLAGHAGPLVVPAPVTAEVDYLALAARCRTKRLLTFDERRFRAIRPLDGGAFELLPADA